MIARHLSQLLDQYSHMFPAVFVTGARQTGKTTLFRNASFCSDSSYVTFDDPTLVLAAQNDPGFFLSLHGTPLVLDEVQYVPSLFRYLKLEIDRDRRNGMYYLTGSQQFSLMERISESLAGRVGVLNLYGLSLREMQADSFTERLLPDKDYILRRNPCRKMGISDIWNIIFQGSYPEVIANGVLPAAFYGSYLRTYIERDVRQLSQVGNEMEFLQFIAVAAARTGQLVNYADMARTVGIDTKTAKRWLSILETTNLVYLLRPYAGNVEKRLVKTPKLYFADTGLAAYLTRWTSPEVIASGAMAGAFFETFCVMEAVKSFANAGEIPPLYYYRDSEGTEIDLLIDIDGKIFPIECKATASPSRKDAGNLRTASSIKGHTIEKGIVLCNCSEPAALSEEAIAIPYWYI